MIDKDNIKYNIDRIGAVEPIDYYNFLYNKTLKIEKDRLGECTKLYVKWIVEEEIPDRLSKKPIKTTQFYPKDFKEMEFAQVKKYVVPRLIEDYGLKVNIHKRSFEVYGWAEEEESI